MGLHFKDDEVVDGKTEEKHYYMYAAVPVDVLDGGGSQLTRLGASAQYSTKIVRQDLNYYCDGDGWSLGDGGKDLNPEGLLNYWYIINQESYAGNFDWRSRSDNGQLSFEYGASTFVPLMNGDGEWASNTIAWDARYDEITLKPRSDLAGSLYSTTTIAGATEYLPYMMHKHAFVNGGNWYMFQPDGADSVYGIPAAWDQLVSSDLGGIVVDSVWIEVVDDDAVGADDNIWVLDPVNSVSNKEYTDIDMDLAMPTFTVDFSKAIFPAGYDIANLGVVDMSVTTHFSGTVSMGTGLSYAGKAFTPDTVLYTADSTINWMDSSGGVFPAAGSLNYVPQMKAAVKIGGQSVYDPVVYLLDTTAAHNPRDAREIFPDISIIDSYDISTKDALISFAIDFTRLTISQQSFVNTYCDTTAGKMSVLFKVVLRPSISMQFNHVAGSWGGVSTLRSCNTIKTDFTTSIIDVRTTARARPGASNWPRTTGHQALLTYSPQTLDQLVGAGAWDIASGTSPYQSVSRMDLAALLEPSIEFVDGNAVVRNVEYVTTKDQVTPSIARPLTGSTGLRYTLEASIYDHADNSWEDIVPFGIVNGVFTDLSQPFTLDTLVPIKVVMYASATTLGSISRFISSTSGITMRLNWVIDWVSPMLYDAIYAVGFESYRKRTGIALSDSSLRIDFMRAPEPVNLESNEVALDVGFEFEPTMIPMALEPVATTNLAFAVDLYSAGTMILDGFADGDFTFSMSSVDPDTSVNSALVIERLDVIDPSTRAVLRTFNSATIPIADFLPGTRSMRVLVVLASNSLGIEPGEAVDSGDNFMDLRRELAIHVSVNDLVWSSIFPIAGAFGIAMVNDPGYITASIDYTVASTPGENIGIVDHEMVLDVDIADPANAQYFTFSIGGSLDYLVWDRESAGATSIANPTDPEVFADFLRRNGDGKTSIVQIFNQVTGGWTSMITSSGTASLLDGAQIPAGVLQFVYFQGVTRDNSPASDFIHPGSGDDGPYVLARIIMDYEYLVEGMNVEGVLATMTLTSFAMKVFSDDSTRAARTIDVEMPFSMTITPPTGYSIDDLDGFSIQGPLAVTTTYTRSDGTTVSPTADAAALEGFVILSDASWLSLSGYPGTLPLGSLLDFKILSSIVMLGGSGAYITGTIRSRLIVSNRNRYPVNVVRSVNPSAITASMSWSKWSETPISSTPSSALQIADVDGDFARDVMTSGWSYARNEFSENVYTMKIDFLDATGNTLVSDPIYREIVVDRQNPSVQILMEDTPRDQAMHVIGGTTSPAWYYMNFTSSSTMAFAPIDSEVSFTVKADASSDFHVYLGKWPAGSSPAWTSPAEIATRPVDLLIGSSASTIRVRNASGTYADTGVAFIRDAWNRITVHVYSDGVNPATWELRSNATASIGTGIVAAPFGILGIQSFGIYCSTSSSIYVDDIETDWGAIAERFERPYAPGDDVGVKASWDAVIATTTSHARIVTVTSSSAGMVEAGGEITFTTLTYHTHITRIEMEWSNDDGTTWTGFGTPVTGSPISNFVHTFSWNTVGLNGIYLVKAVATDVNNMQGADVIPIKIDNTAPTGGIIGTSFVTGNLASRRAGYNFQFFEANSFTGLEITLTAGTGASEIIKQFTPLLAGTSGNTYAYSVTLESFWAENSAYNNVTIRWRATDRAGNEITGTRHVIRDDTVKMVPLPGSMFDDSTPTLVYGDQVPVLVTDSFDQPLANRRVSMYVNKYVYQQSMTNAQGVALFILDSSDSYGFDAMDSIEVDFTSSPFYATTLSDFPFEDLRTGVTSSQRIAYASKGASVYGMAENYIEMRMMMGDPNLNIFKILPDYAASIDGFLFELLIPARVSAYWKATSYESIVLTFLDEDGFEHPYTLDQQELYDLYSAPTAQDVLVGGDRCRLIRVAVPIHGIGLESEDGAFALTKMVGLRITGNDFGIIFGNAEEFVEGLVPSQILGVMGFIPMFTIDSVNDIAILVDDQSSLVLEEASTTRAGLDFTFPIGYNFNAWLTASEPYVQIDESKSATADGTGSLLMDEQGEPGLLDPFALRAVIEESWGHPDLVKLDIMSNDDRARLTFKAWGVGMETFIQVNFDFYTDGSTRWAVVSFGYNGASPVQYMVSSLVPDQWISIDLVFKWGWQAFIGYVNGVEVGIVPFLQNYVYGDDEPRVYDEID
ncbi:MAG: hypothetical protein GYA24_13325, partial [Candidatus Lokiarchaeota archaeon]|nr:hypothetical protein [Candidatus Lokiarchaeota archaeon]